jgi:outer membrane protein assembly factor BamA
LLFVTALVTLLLFFPVHAAAQTSDAQTSDTRTAGAETAESGGNRVSGVTVIGLKRTRPHVAEQPLRKFIGMEIDAINTEDVYAAIMDMGILEPVEVFFADDLERDEGLGSEAAGKILVAVVEEKWAFFPLPIIVIGSDTSNFGLAIMDSNAFGLNDKMILMGMYSPEGSWAATGMYIATPDRDRGIGWQVIAFYTDRNRTDTDQKKSVLRQFNTTSAEGGVGLSYSFTSLLSASLSVRVQNHALRETTAPVAMPERGMIGIGITPSLSIRHNDWDGYFLSDQGASVDYIYHIEPDGPSFHSVSFRGTFVKSLVPGFRIDVKTGITYAPEAPVFFESSPSSARVDILPSSFSARNYAGVSAGLEKHLVKFGFGALSVAAAYQVLWSEGPILGHQFDHGPAGSIRLYLSRVAIPAMGFGVAYNVRAEYLQGTFTIGMNF